VAGGEGIRKGKREERKRIHSIRQADPRQLVRREKKKRGSNRRGYMGNNRGIRKEDAVGKGCSV